MISLNPSKHARFSIAYFCYFLFVAGLIAFWPLWLKAKGFSIAEIGYLSAAFLVTKILAPSFWGVLADRTGKHLKLMQICGLLGLLCFSVIFVRTDFRSLLVVVLVFSLFWNAVMPQLEVLTLQQLSQDQQESRYTLIRLWGSISFILTVSLLGFYFDRFSILNLPYLLSGALLCLLLASLFLPKVKTYKRSTTSPNIYSVLKRPEVFGFLFVCFLLQVSHGPYYTFYSVHLEEMGYSRKVIGGLWSLGVVAEVGLYVYMRKVYERFSLRLLLNVTLLLTILRWLLIANFSENFNILMFAQILHAFSYGCYHAVGIVLIKRFFAQGNEATGMGLYSGVSFGAGGTLGAYLSGMIWAYSEWLSFMLAALVAAVAYLVAYIFVRGEVVDQEVI